jgi:type I restriction enzyme, S subunit
MINFTQKKWGDVCTLEYGKGIRDYKNEDNDYSVYGSAGRVGTHSEFHIEKGVIVSRKGTLDVHYSDKPFFVIDTAFFLNPKPELNPKWAYYALKNFDIKKLTSGSAVPSLSREEFYAESLYLPPLEYQVKVAYILSNIDKKIELNQKINEKLEEFAKTLFKSWFIDFDPVRAKAEGRPTGLSKEISDLFPDSFEDSELGKIPKNYKVGKLEELAKYLNRGVSPSYVENNGVYLVNQKCIRNGKIDFNLCKQSKEKSSMNERYLEKYDILLNSMGVGTLGRVAMFYKFDKKITADALVTIIKGESVGSSFFIYYFLERMEDYLNTISVGSTGQTSLKKEDILDLQMTIPPKNLLDEFGIQLSMFAEKKYLNNQENLILRDLRDALLPKLISGELKIPDAESLIEEASI